MILRLWSVSVCACLVACAPAEPAAQVSPSERYEITATVDEVPVQSGVHEHVVLHLLDAGGQELSAVDTRASDLQKWAVGWMTDTDTVVFYSSDIGTRAYLIESSQFVGVEVTSTVQGRACLLYELKYERTSGICSRASGIP